MNDLQRMRQLAGLTMLKESVQAVPGLGEAITPKEIDSAQNDIDLDQGSQFMEEDEVDEDIESPAQVVSCNQDNPSAAREACAMEESSTGGPTEFRSSKEAYDAIQTGKCPQGSIFTVPSERIVGIADTWPVALTKEYGVLHQFKDGLSTEEKARTLKVSSEVIQQAEQMAQEMDGQMQEAYDMNNGYYDEKSLDGEDYFPTGADSPVVGKVGPSGARQGDNPEQKKMEVTETHKELVYAYRNYLKESAQLNELSKDTLKSYATKRGEEVYSDQRDAETSRGHSKYATKKGDPKSAAAWDDDADWLDKRAEKGAGNVAKAVIKSAKK